MSSAPSGDYTTPAGLAAATIPAGSVIGGKYRIERVLGVGGMGAVYEGRHLLLNQRIAIKVLRADRTGAPEHVARFAREARAAASIESPHIVRVMDVGALDSGVPFMVLEYLKGVDLARLLKERGDYLGVEEVCSYVLEACEALAEAHKKSIIHRDLKPSNLFLARRPDGSDVVKVLDFGVSKFLAKSEASVDAAGDFQTNTAAAIGSPQYMSPEQLRDSRGVDQRSDVWALGVVLYRLLTKKHPFSGETQADLVVSILLHTPEKPRTHRPDLPEALEAAIMKCLEKDPDRRFADVGGLARALGPFAPKAAASVERIVRTLAAQAGTPSNPPPDEAGEIEIHTVEIMHDGAVPQSHTPSLTTNAAAATVTESTGFPAGVPKSRATKWIALGGAGLVAVAAIAVGISSARGTDTTASATNVSPPPSAIAPPERSAIPPPPEPTEAPAPEESATPATSATTVAVTNTKATSRPHVTPPRPKPTATVAKPGDIPSYGGRK